MSTQDSGSWDSGRDRWQAIRNELEIPPRREQRNPSAPIPVRVRLDWEHDGVEHLVTIVIAWTSTAVLVELHDVRYRIHGVWVAPGDVERR